MDLLKKIKTEIGELGNPGANSGDQTFLDSFNTPADSGVKREEIKNG
jgi:hypothetical protein